MYEVKFYMDGDITHYVKVTSEELTEFIDNIDEDSNPDFIGITCADNGCEFLVNRKKLNAYSYKEVPYVH